MQPLNISRQQGAGEQGLISKPIHAVSPPHLAEVDEEEIKNLVESNNGTAIQDDSDQTDPDKEDVDSEELSEDVKQRVLRDYMRKKKKQKKDRQRRDKIQREMEKAAAANTVLTPAGSAEFPGGGEGGHHDMAPGVPTGPGEGTRRAGAFPGLIIQTEDEDYRGMQRGPPDSGPGAGEVPQGGVQGAQGSGSGRGPETVGTLGGAQAGQGPAAGGGAETVGELQKGVLSGQGAEGKDQTK